MANRLEEIQNGSIRQINAYYRGIDESHLWPVCNRFNVTERAIRRLRKLQLCDGGLEYFLAFGDEIGRAVNEAI